MCYVYNQEKGAHTRYLNIWIYPKNQKQKQFKNLVSGK